VQSITSENMVLLVLALADGRPLTRGRLCLAVLSVQKELLACGVEVLPEPYPVGAEDVEEIAELLRQEG
jgi:hypothetical protein